MTSLYAIIAALSPEEKATLRQKIALSRTVPDRLIAVLLAETPYTEEEFIAQEGITKATFHKSKTYACAKVFTSIMESNQEKQNKVYSVRWLHRRGFYKEARHQFSRLEKELQEENRLSELAELYQEAISLSHKIGDIEWMEELVGKVNTTLQDNLRLTALDNAIRLETLKIAKKKYNKNHIEYEQYLLELYYRARELRNTPMTSRALLCMYMYGVWIGKTQEEITWILWEMEQYVRDAGKANREIYLIFCHILANYRCHYLIPQCPLEFYDSAERYNSTHPSTAILFYFQFFEYFFFQRDMEQAMNFAGKIQQIAWESSLYIKYAVQTFLAWSRGDVAAVRESMTAFFRENFTVVLPDLEYNIRIFEVMLALKEKDFHYAELKIDALRKFVAKNNHFSTTSLGKLVNLLARLVRSISTKIPIVWEKTSVDPHVRSVQYFMEEMRYLA